MRIHHYALSTAISGSTLFSPHKTTKKRYRLKRSSKQVAPAPASAPKSSMEVTINLLRKGSFSENAIRAVIHPSYRDLNVIRMSQQMQIKASELRERFSLSHFDSLIVAAALLSGSTVLYSEDMQHNLQIDTQLTILNPFLSFQAS